MLGNTNAETSVAFLQQLREKQPEPLIVLWDNGPAHHGPEIRAYLTTPDLKLRLVAVPGYSPDFNPDQASWDWMREDVPANNVCYGTAAKVREKVDAFCAGLAERQADAEQRCRRDLQAPADALVATTKRLFAAAQHVDLTLPSV